MCSVFRCLALLALSAMPPIVAAGTLRVCSDPNNLPYSNQEQQGFENRIASLIASDLGETLEYFWFPQRSKFFSQTLNRGVCDVVMGVPTGMDDAAATRPYYRSTYVFVTRRASALHIDSFDDPRLRSLKIGVHILGDQDDNLPPVNALIHRGIVKNLAGYSIFGNLNEKDPPADVLRALQDGSVDVPLDVVPVAQDPKFPEIPLQFDIAIGVRGQDISLKQELDHELERRRSEIAAILQEYGIPQLPLPPETSQLAISGRQP